jgi:hypothetical protein
VRQIVLELPPEFGRFVLVFAAIGAVSAVLANRGLSIFHDGLRPLIPSMVSGVLPRRDIANTSFRLGLGFFWSFALPFSLGLTIPLVYLIFMATDWIGVRFNADHDRRWYESGLSLRGLGGSAVAGAAWSAAVAVGVYGVVNVMQDLPIPMADAMAQVADPVIFIFFLFPVLTVGYQYGLRHSIAGLGIGTVVWFAVASQGNEHHAAIWAFVATLAHLAVVAFGKIRAIHLAGDDVDPNDILARWEQEAEALDTPDDWEQFRKNIARIKRSIIPLASLYALMGAAYHLAIMSNGPIAGRLYSTGFVVPAALVMLAWALSYVPMKFATAVVTGCMATGTFMDMAVAILMPNWWSAALALFILRFVEVWSLEPVVRFLDAVPEVRGLSETMRTSIFHVMEIGFLIGGGLVAAQFAGMFGFGAVVVIWWINSKAGSKIMPMAVGALAALLVGFVANFFEAVGLGMPT